MSLAQATNAPTAFPLLEGKVALVTGAGSGIGRAGAMAMARHGARVVVTDLDGGKAAQVFDALQAEGIDAVAAGLDVTDDAAVADQIDQIVQDFGRIDVLHSHAGYQIEGNLEQVPIEGMDRSWQLNVRSHFIAARATIGHMRAQRGGSIIITSSNSGVQYDREMIAYATTKHAVVAMTRQMAADYAKENIRFNALCPGFIDTPFNAGFETQMGGREKLEDYVSRTIPMGRWGTTSEIADSILFLASDMSTFMTGHALVIDGGECI
ncbi:SDR family NAD(P)-dependent oxidoreductase [Alisedimentitalea sp. MJ-SS2]|uniref:SDR family NAD(P)-dependent oxidoreductase n=1 Tax=Aliisedimentitalea sp. MJ-SS2 TaxID=3049795 RepID=UPI00291078D7|nr:SDR family NAD(P)-dependent oxidoreductase [Alisedimentitalea sp. MJ-SS2]MDU8926460.1 SDR family NAD(P)-dependent oxidoreductase [Alisedimentitalea sp. MJ-SS2]